MLSQARASVTRAPRPDGVAWIVGSRSRPEGSRLPGRRTFKSSLAKTVSSVLVHFLPLFRKLHVFFVDFPRSAGSWNEYTPMTGLFLRCSQGRCCIFSPLQKGTSVFQIRWTRLCYLLASLSFFPRGCRLAASRSRGQDDCLSFTKVLGSRRLSFRGRAGV